MSETKFISQDSSIYIQNQIHLSKQKYDWDQVHLPNHKKTRNQGHFFKKKVHLKSSSSLQMDKRV